MGLWNFIKRLLAVVLAYLWNRVTEGLRTNERPDTDLRTYSRGGDHIRSSPTPPSHDPAFSPGFRAHDLSPYRPDIYQGRYAPETAGYSRGYGGEPAYSSSYPAGSLRSYPGRKAWAYSGPPVYRSKVQDLYEDDVLVYRDGRFSFAEKQGPYSGMSGYGTGT